MTAKFQHLMTKFAQEEQAAALTKKAKKPTKQKIVLAPTPLLYAMVVLKDNTRGRIVGYTGTADSQVFILRTDFGDLVKFTRDQIASYK